MTLSRRDFITTSALSAAGACLPGPKLLHAGAAFRSEAAGRCAIIDLGPECLLSESLLGYQQACAETGATVVQLLPATLAGRSTFIVPGTGVIGHSTAAILLDFLNQGMCVLLESAAGFCHPSRFAGQQEIFYRYFDLSLQEPVDLWSENSVNVPMSRDPGANLNLLAGQSTPYIHYLWPATFTVRDFSRAIPIAAKGEDVIAYAGLRPVAVRKQVGSGLLVFLGSPLGPGLRAGEPEARSWLRLVFFR